MTVSGGGLSRVFQVDAGVTASISGLTITGGKTDGNGGGLYNDGGNDHADRLHRQRQLRLPARRRRPVTTAATVTLTNCTVSGNSATSRRRPVQQLRHDHADQLHRQRQLRHH